MIADDKRLEVALPFSFEKFDELYTRAYGWTVFTNGEIAGLTTGDMGYEDCETQWGALISEAVGAASGTSRSAEIEKKLEELIDLCHQALKAHHDSHVI